MYPTKREQPKMPIQDKIFFGIFTTGMLGFLSCYISGEILAAQTPTDTIKSSDQAIMKDFAIAAGSLVGFGLLCLFISGLIQRSKKAESYNEPIELENINNNKM